jgi:transposase-like protein
MAANLSSFSRSDAQPDELLREVRWRHPRPGNKWRSDEMQLKINGRKH